jgi:hypothetical protein
VNSSGLVEMTRVAGFEIRWLSKRILVPYGAGNTDPAPARIHSIAGRQPTTRGILHRALRAAPRSRRPRR